VACWGGNDQDQLGRPGKGPSTGVPAEVSGTRGALAVSAGNRHTCALMPGGQVICWGFGNHGQLGNGKTKNSDSPVLAGKK
jgi:alpha-tubulin suppressor-like RCC1 family protein